MAKDPAFLFYYQDFLVGTTFMSLEDMGAYIKLLCFLADKDSLTEEQVIKIIPRSVWESISCKFLNEGGNIYNQRLRDEVDKRKKYTVSRRRNLKHTETHMGKHMQGDNGTKCTAHMEDEDEDESIISPLVNYWNNQSKLRRVVTIGYSRSKKIKERLKSEHFRENWQRAVDRMVLSSFCTGGNDRGWQADVDWFVANDHNYVKILEGKYDNRTKDRFSQY